MALRPAAGQARLTPLDGLRAVAVAMVMAYHGGVAGLRTAGFFGVDVFFVLSGFLITTLLLNEQGEAGSIRLGPFWGRRARRLLPGLIVMLIAVDLYVAYVAPQGRYPGFRGDALSVVVYFSNWHFIAASSNYFAANGLPSLLTHTWSLAIEEQFYLVWPLVLWGAIRLAGRVRRPPAAVVLALAAAGALASAGWMAALYRAGAGPSRLYYGTDTHAQSILVGAALAGLLALRPSLTERIPATAVAVVGVGGLVWASTDLGYSDPLTYQGGFLAVGFLAAVVVAGLVARPTGAAARALSFGPVVYLGRISYGMYLWYFPLFEVLDHSRTGLSGTGLFVLRCAADVVLAALSFHLVEQPVRHWRRHPHVPGRALAPVAAAVGAMAGVATLVLADTPAAFSAGSGPALTAASSPRPEPEPASTPGALRVLVIGDSTGMVLGDDLSLPEVERQYGIDVQNGAILGCGIADSAKVLDHGAAVDVPAACNSATPPDQLWPALLRVELDRFRPDVVLLVAGRWETKDRRPTASSPWTDITRPADASYVRSQLEMAVDLAASTGAHVGVATSPCFSSGEQPSGAAWPEDDPSRVKAYNGIVRSVAAEHAGAASVVDLYGMLCPDGRYHETLDGATVRNPDGVHYPLFSVSDPNAPDPNTIGQATRFGQWIASRILSVVGA